MTTAAVMKNSPVDRKTCPGQKGSPTTLSSRVRAVRYWVCFCSHSSPRWAAMPPISRPGSSITWNTNRRLRMSGVGNSPPKNSDATHGPTNGIDSMTESMIRSPVPDRRSSGSE